MYIKKSTLRAGCGEGRQLAVDRKGQVVINILYMSLLVQM